MLTIFEQIIIGHLIGDYLLQPKEMAIKKSENGMRGLFICLLHCAIYTAAVSISTSSFGFTKIFLIFLSHFPIDRYSLAKNWLKMIRGREFEIDPKGKYAEINTAFTAITYTVVDNSLHLLLMLAVFRFF